MQGWLFFLPHVLIVLARSKSTAPQVRVKLPRLTRRGTLHKAGMLTAQLKQPTVRKDAYLLLCPYKLGPLAGPAIPEAYGPLPSSGH